MKDPRSRSSTPPKFILQVPITTELAILTQTPSDSARQMLGLLDKIMIASVVLLPPDRYWSKDFSTSHHEVTVCSCMLIVNPSLHFDTKCNVHGRAHGKPESMIHEDGLECFVHTHRVLLELGSFSL